MGGESEQKLIGDLESDQNHSLQQRCTERRCLLSLVSFLLKIKGPRPDSNFGPSRGGRFLVFGNTDGGNRQQGARRLHTSSNININTLPLLCLLGRSEILVFTNSPSSCLHRHPMLLKILHLIDHRNARLLI